MANIIDTRQMRFSQLVASVGRKSALLALFGFLLTAILAFAPPPAAAADDLSLLKSVSMYFVRSNGEHGCTIHAAPSEIFSMVYQLKDSAGNNITSLFNGSRKYLACVGLVCAWDNRQATRDNVPPYEYTYAGSSQSMIKAHTMKGNRPTDGSTYRIYQVTVVIMDAKTRAPITTFPATMCYVYYQ